MTKIFDNIDIDLNDGLFDILIQMKQKSDKLRIFNCTFDTKDDEAIIQFYATDDKCMLKLKYDNMRENFDITGGYLNENQVNKKLNMKTLEFEKIG